MRLTKNPFRIKMSSSSTSSDVLPPPIFTGENYHVWSVFMRHHLTVLDLWDQVSPDRDGRVKIEAEEGDSSRVKKTKALLLVLRSVA